MSIHSATEGKKKKQIKHGQNNVGVGAFWYCWALTPYVALWPINLE